MSEASGEQRRKHPGGRPTLYRPEFCEAVIEDGKAGYSLTAFAATIGVTRETLHHWQTIHPEFSDAVKLHKAHRARKWEARMDKIGEDGAPGPGAATVTIFALKNIAPEEFRDRVEHVGNPEEPIKHAVTHELGLDTARRLAFLLAAGTLQSAPAPKTIEHQPDESA